MKVSLLLPIVLLVGGTAYAGTDVGQKDTKSKEVIVEQETQKEVIVEQEAQKEVVVEQEAQKDVIVEQEEQKEVVVEQEAQKDVVQQEDVSQKGSIEQECYRPGGGMTTDWYEESYAIRDEYWADCQGRQEARFAACAPEVVDGNLKATDRTLKELASSKDFRGADRFNKAVSNITSFKNNRAKMAAYLDMIGVDPADDRAIAEFVGSRSAKAEWLHSLKRNADLNDYQAERVVESIKTSLKGGLR